MEKFGEKIKEKDISASNTRCIFLEWIAKAEYKLKREAAKKEKEKLRKEKEKEDRDDSNSEKTDKKEKK